MLSPDTVNGRWPLDQTGKIAEAYAGSGKLISEKKFHKIWSRFVSLEGSTTISMMGDEL
jgi:hypothetical protein